MYLSNSLKKIWSNAARAAPRIIPDLSALGTFSVINFPNPDKPNTKIIRVNSMHIAIM